MTASQEAARPVFTPTIARLFNMEGTVFKDRDRVDKIPNLLPRLPDGSLCPNKSKFEDCKGIIEMLKLASRNNRGYIEREYQLVTLMF